MPDPQGGGDDGAVNISLRLVRFLRHPVPRFRACRPGCHVFVTAGATITRRRRYETGYLAFRGVSAAPRLVVIDRFSPLTARTR